MTWQDAMDYYGSDKPDLRFDMKIQDVSELVKDCGFGVFTGAIENGGMVRGLCAKGLGDVSSKKMKHIEKTAKDYGALLCNGSLPQTTQVMGILRSIQSDIQIYQEDSVLLQI